MQYDDIVRLAQDVGLNENRARIAAAIAMAESGGNPSAVVHDSDDDSYGLWQINMKGSLGPDRRRKYGLPNNDALLDPRRNAMVMADLSNNGGNFSAWTTYTSGKYRDFVKDKSILDKAGDVASGALGGIGNAADNLNEIRQAVVKTAAWVSNSDNWIRVAYVAGGSLVILIALGALMRNTSVGRRAAAIPKRVATQVRATGKSNAQARAKTKARMDKDVPNAR